jgi:two-component system chemotaxis response regulator CheY
MSLRNRYIKWYRKNLTKKQKKNILVVDDDLAIRTILANVLSTKYNITSASSGLEAMFWLTEGNFPDLIISDINMPELDGPAFVKALNQSDLYNTIPVIILTGQEDEEFDDQILLYDNLKARLTKPFDPLSIKENISTILQEGVITA